MKSLKPIAQEIIDIKKEILKNEHSDVVKKALEISVDRMLVEGYIDLDIQLYLKDNSYSVDELKKVLKTSNKYIKTESELIVEYESLVNKLKALINKSELSHMEYYLNVDIKKNAISICKVYSLEEKFLKKYFYLQGDADDYFEKLMKKKGFIQQFAVLRLPRILSNFIKDNNYSEDYKISKSHTYYQADKNRYSIDLVFTIEANKIDVMKSDSEVLGEIYATIECANKYFEEKLSI